MKLRYSLRCVISCSRANRPNWTLSQYRIAPGVHVNGSLHMSCVIRSMSAASFNCLPASRFTLRKSSPNGFDATLSTLSVTRRALCVKTAVNAGAVCPRNKSTVLLGTLNEQSGHCSPHPSHSEKIQPALGIAPYSTGAA